MLCLVSPPCNLIEWSSSTFPPQLTRYTSAAAFWWEVLIMTSLFKFGCCHLRNVQCVSCCTAGWLGHTCCYGNKRSTLLAFCPLCQSINQWKNYHHMISLSYLPICTLDTDGGTNSWSLSSHWWTAVMALICSAYLRLWRTPSCSPLVCAVAKTELSYKILISPACGHLYVCTMYTVCVIYGHARYGIIIWSASQIGHLFSAAKCRLHFKLGTHADKETLAKGC